MSKYKYHYEVILLSSTNQYMFSQEKDKKYTFMSLSAFCRYIGIDRDKLWQRFKDEQVVGASMNVTLTLKDNEEYTYRIRLVHAPIESATIYLTTVATEEVLNSVAENIGEPCFEEVGFFNVKQTAEYLHVMPKTLYEMIRTEGKETGGILENKVYMKKVLPYTLQVLRPLPSAVGNTLSGSTAIKEYVENPVKVEVINHEEEINRYGDDEWI